MPMAKLRTIAACFVVVAAYSYGVRSASPQDEGAKAVSKPTDEATERTKRDPPPPFALRDDYVVEPPDLIFVSLEGGLPGRPLAGERLVCPNGKIALAWYGYVDAAGLTVVEIKEKIIARLQKFLRDEQLGLVELDASGEPIVDATTGRPKRIAPRDSKKVRVEITRCNSKVFYVLGEVQSPGRFALTGSERILDAIADADGPTHAANLDRVLLYRANSEGKPECTTIDVNQLKRGKFPATNRPLKAGDRLVVSRRSSEAVPIQRDKSRARPQPAVAAASQNKDGEYQRAGTEDASLQRLEQRMKALDHKLDLVLEAIRKRVR